MNTDGNLSALDEYMRQEHQAYVSAKKCAMCGEPIYGKYYDFDGEYICDSDDCLFELYTKVEIVDLIREDIKEYIGKD